MHQLQHFSCHGPGSHAHGKGACLLRRKDVVVVADSHLKWLEVLLINSTTAGSTITELRKLFSVYGLSEYVVSDHSSLPSSLASRE